MKQKIKPNPNSSLSKKEQVSEMFDDISSSYDKVNRFISLGLDRLWKRRLVNIAVRDEPQHLLDLATGTADLPLSLAKAGVPHIVALDISPLMLEEGKRRVAAAQLSGTIILQVGDSENLPFSNERFEVVTVSYGLRNFEDLEKGLSEALRVLKPGGRFVILETSVPSSFPFKQCYGFFTRKIMPLIGHLLSGDKKAYKYLSESANNFPYGKALVKILEQKGFINIEIKPQFFGAATIYVCRK